MKVKVTGIKWDVDNKKDLTHLPKSMILDIPDDIEDDELEDFICNELSNTSGFCHYGWGEHEEIDICSECGKEMTQNDECYCDHESGFALCGACSVQCRGCGNAIASSKVVGDTEYYCEVCSSKADVLPSLSEMNLEAFEKHDGNFTFSTGILPVIGQGFCLQNGMVYCKVEDAYEWFFANRKDAFERISKQNREVPYAYLELNNGFSIESLLGCIQAIKSCSSNPQSKCFNANDYSTRQLLEMEFENLPNGEHKDNMIDEALQLVEECAYTVGEAANEVLSEAKGQIVDSITGIPQLQDIKKDFLSFVGYWINGQECRTGENRTDGTVTYNQDGLYLYEFQTREDAFKYLFEDNRSVPYAIGEYYEEASIYNGEETFDELKYYNGFNPSWIDSKRALQIKVVSF